MDLLKKILYNRKVFENKNLVENMLLQAVSVFITLKLSGG